MRLYRCRACSHNSFDRIQERSDCEFPRGRWEGVSTTHNSDLNAVFWCTVVTGLELSGRRAVRIRRTLAPTGRKGYEIPSAPAALSSRILLGRAASFIALRQAREGPAWLSRSRCIPHKRCVRPTRGLPGFRALGRRRVASLGARRDGGAGRIRFMALGQARRGVSVC